ncbi:hypothetical protein C8R45DRAFT_951875 [Mycena sanguinolenta]|nr:hypothetical protein C8R45DRAFT_951875 [Mycena sanguinolenta]
MTSHAVLNLNSPMTSESHKNIALYGYRDPKSFARPPKLAHTLPDPNQFPDPYPYRQQHSLSSTPPALSSSSSGSARSSAYTSGGSGGSALVADFSHVRVASNDNDDDGRITSDSVSQLIERDLPAQDHSHWSEASIRSRSSSVGASSNDHHMSPHLEPKKSYDMGWQFSPDERDELAASEEETDEDPILLPDEDDQDDEERTSAALIAEEGRGMIVQGEGVALNDLVVLPGTTHLLLGSSGSPNALPSFLTTVIPQICTSLLALDISANFLNALPPTLALCVCLEELNIASNPLRVLPVFLADLVHLCVIIADSTGISTLPDTLVDLDKLHTISVRRNKMHALPSWLSLLPALQTLYVDGNPFQGPWKALVEPLLAKVPSTPIYPLSTPTFPLNSPSSGDQDTTDDDLSEPPSSGPDRRRFESMPPDEEEHTITPDRARSPADVRGLTRTRTTPNRPHHPIPRRGEAPAATVEDAGYFADHEVRRMKSAGDLRLNRGGEAVARPPMQHYATSQSSTNLLSNQSPPRPGMQKRFASVGPAAAMTMDGSPSRGEPSRPQLTQSMWANPAPLGANDDPARSRSSSFINQSQNNMSPPRTQPMFDSATIRAAPVGKEKNSRWGFLKKMSMGKMKVDPPSPRPMPAAAPRMMRGPSTAPISDGSPGRFNPSQLPQINMRISTTGTLDAFTTPSIHTLAPAAEQDEHVSRPSSATSPTLTVPNTGNSLLVPPTTTRTAKRRSFLPLETPALTLNIPIPEAAAFVPGVTATGEDGIDRGETPSPAVESYIRREEERAREAYQRALRSVMAYLKDMNDLGMSQQAAAMGVYGAGGDEALQSRSRRPTLAGLEREASVSSNGSSLDSTLRSLDSMTGIRSGNSTQTNSVATTDSSGSGDERKFKDDKGKRAMVAREIVVTERTYVKGLQELVDIYIKPGGAPVNVLGGSSKDSVVPASERKIVFGGIDALFSFHKDSFLPALEHAAAPIMKSSSELAEADADGQLSLSVAKAIGSVFLKHSAFMKMYSSYINNFDNAVQRVKNWSVAPGPANGPSSVTPSGSQLAGLGLSLTSISAPGVILDASAASGVPPLSTSQRKRLRTYLKRCRISPRHSQLNLEGYLLLPVQRIPRYRLLLEELLRATPPTYEYMDDPLDRSLAEISLLANNMNEGKRESESRRKLVQWQSRIRGKFPSPLVQPHRRLIMDGQLLLTRVVRKALVSFEAINAQGDPCTVQVDCLAPELTPRPLVGILCNDLLVLCRDPSEGQDPTCHVDLWAVLRMQTLPQPASIVHGNALRLVDNKAILYFDAPSPSDALNWYRAINLHIPKT